MSGLLAIVNASDTDFKKLASSIENADGASEKMANTMNDNLKGSVTIAGSALEGFGINVYEKMEKPLKVRWTPVQKTSIGYQRRSQPVA